MISLDNIRNARVKAYKCIKAVGFRRVLKGNDITGTRLSLSNFSTHTTEQKQEKT